MSSVVFAEVYALKPTAENGVQERLTDSEVSPWTWDLPVSLPIAGAGWLSDALEQHNGIISPEQKNATVRDDIIQVLDNLGRKK